MKPEEVQFPTAQRVQFLMSFDKERDILRKATAYVARESQ